MEISGQQLAAQYLAWRGTLANRGAMLALVFHALTKGNGECDGDNISPVAH